MEVSGAVLSIQDKNAVSAMRRKIIESEDEFLIQCMKNNHFEDEYLLRFIRSRGYDTDSAFNRIKRLHELRLVKYPELFIMYIPSRLKEGFNCGAIRILKQRDPLGQQVMILRLRYWDPSVVSGDEAFLNMAMTGWQLLNTIETQEKGIITIFDVAGCTLAQAKFFTPAFVMKWANIIVQSSPIKIKAMHFVSVHTAFKMALSTIKMFAPRKIAERIIVHRGPYRDFLSEHVPSCDLPVSLGGQLEEEEAFDQDFMPLLFSPETENYYAEKAKASFEVLKQRKYIL